jgi:RNA polymerase sigma-70 factor (ECF subfamily)
MGTSPPGAERDDTFATLALPLFRALYATARRLTGNAHDAEDLVQETYLRGYRAFHSFEPGTNLRAWLYAILRSARADALRKRGPVLVADAALEGGPALPPLQLQLGATWDLEAALARVPEVFREALVLRDVQDWSYDEIARALDVPIGTVMSRLSRGRALLRRALQEPRR